MKNILAFTIGLLLVLPAGRASAMTSDPDAETLGLIQAIDRHEIQEAQAAKQKSNIDRKVYDFANMMEKEHSKNLDKDRELARKTGIQPAESAAVQNQRSKGNDEIAKLSPLDGAEFASAYIAGIIQDHRNALSLLDAQAGQIQNKDLQKHVRETRGHVQHHLDKAQKIQEELAKP